MKANSKRTSGISLSPLGAQSNHIGAASQTLLVEIKLRLRRRQCGIIKGAYATVKNNAVKDDFCPEAYDRSRLFFLHKMHSIVI